jgi:thiamine transport system substrate-binding protein
LLSCWYCNFGDSFTEYWQALKDNSVVVVDGWETAYYTNFSGSSGRGPQPMVVSYGTSPAVEVVYAEKPMDDAPTASILGPDTCFRQIEFVGILKGTHGSASPKNLWILCSAGNSRKMFLRDVCLSRHPDAVLPDNSPSMRRLPSRLLCWLPKKLLPIAIDGSKPGQMLC